jgi:hypothetical protein
MLVALGLDACGESDVSACLSMVLTTEGSSDGSDTSGSSDTGSSGSDSTTESDVGPCLGQVMTTEETGVDTTATDSGSTGDSGTTGTGTDDGSDTATGPCLAPKGDELPDDDDALVDASPSAPSWQDAFERIADKLPADIAARLARRAHRDGGGT